MKRRLNNEERLYRELSAFFKKLKKEVLSALDEYWSDYQMLQGHINLICSPVHEAHREYYEIIKKYKLKEYQLGKQEATRLCNRAGVRYAFKETIQMPLQGFIKKDSNTLFGTLPKAEQDLLNRTFKSSEKTLSRVDGQLNKIITDGYRGGKGINDIANQVTKRFDQLSTWEAKRIARTEVNTSHNKATVDTYQDFGVEYTQWIAAADDRTRDSHVEVDGEIIPMGEKYSNGLSYPGDMSGPIEEWINCRCSNAPFVIPFGYMAPSFSPFRESDLIPIIENPVEPTPEQIDANLTDDQKALYNKYQQNINDAQKVIDSVFSTPNEILQAKHLIETETIKLNQLKQIANGELAKGIATVLKPSQVHPDEKEVHGEPIDISDLYIEDNGYIDVDAEYNGVKFNEKTGKWELNGLEVKDYDPDYDIGTIHIDDVKKHNEKFNTTTDEPMKDILSVSELEYGGQGDFKVSKDLVEIFESKAYYQGLLIENYDFIKGEGWIYENDINSHNKKVVFEGVKRASEEKLSKNLSDSEYMDSLEIYKEINDNLKVLSSPYTSNSAKENAVEDLADLIPEYEKLNKKALNPSKSNAEFIDMTDLLYDSYWDEYKISKSEFEFNVETHKYEYKGLGIDFDEYINSGLMISIKADDIVQHNKQFQTRQLNNPYIDKMKGLTPLKDNGNIYIVDDTTGKKYVYDEKQVFERKQDVEQRKVTYDQHETNSTAHWGRYGHQYINGLIYKVKRLDKRGNIKQDYSYYAPQMDKLTPLYNHAQDLAVDLHEGKIKLANYNKEMGKIFDKAEKIIESCKDDYTNTKLDVKHVKNAMWEIFYMDTSIEKSPRLLQNTFLVRFGHFKAEWCEKGKVIEYDGYTSTTYESGAAGHFEDKMRDNPNRWAILIMAEKGSKGTRLNDQFNALTTEREWLAYRRQNMEVVDFDKNSRTALVKFK